MSSIGKVELFLRVGVAFAFIYPAVAAFFDPFSWIGFFPAFMQGIVPDVVLLSIFGITEVVLALWILIGKRILIPSTFATLYLAGIILFNLALFDIIFRDVPILLMALSLVMLHYEHHAKSHGATEQSHG